MIESNKSQNIVIKKIEKRDASNNSCENLTLKLLLNNKLTLIIKCRKIFEKKIQLRKAIAIITILKTCFVTLKMQIIFESANSVFEKNVNTISNIRNVTLNTVKLIV